jgi:hypothetical protein
MLSTLLLLTLLWTVLGIGILAPILGCTWIIQRLTVLTFPEAGLITFIYVFVLTHLVQTYLKGSKGGWKLGISLFSVAGLTVLMLESYLLHRWVDLTVFQAALLAGGANLLTVYVFAHSLTGSIPSFLRDTIVDNWLDDVDVGIEY